MGIDVVGIHTGPVVRRTKETVRGALTTVAEKSRVVTQHLLEGLQIPGFCSQHPSTALFTRNATKPVPWHFAVPDARRRRLNGGLFQSMSVYPVIERGWVSRSVACTCDSVLLFQPIPRLGHPENYLFYCERTKILNNYCDCRMFTPKCPKKYII